MLALTHRKSSEPNIHSDMVVIFGIGLIGLSIKQSLQAHGYSILIPPEPYAWLNSKTRKSQLRRFGNKIRQSGALSSSGSIHFVWSAGAGGFGASETDMNTEIEVFAEIVNFAQSFTSETKRNVQFHMFSSAGGLFEGQICVNHEHQARPLRPYGRAKQAQENHLLSIPELRSTIYRPSSVYGFNMVGTRQGLILTLLKNGLNGAVTNIFGRPDTLRDFVLVDDIGQCIARRILNNASDKQVVFLTSGKPTTMHEIVSVIQKRLNKTLYLHFVTGHDNTESISFSPKLKSAYWSPTPLSIGIEKTLGNIHQAMSQGVI